MIRYRGAAIALVIATAFGCGGKEKSEGAAVTAPAVVRGATVTPIASETIPELQEAVGSVKAKSTVVIASRLAGSVSAVLVKEGDRVSRGAQLVAIEAAESGAAEQSAVAGVEEASRALDEARSRKRLADATFERYRKLFADQAVTRQEFEVHQSEQEVASQGVARAEARLNQSRQGARAAGTVSSYGRVTSPISGLVMAKQVEGGQTVFPGTPLVTIEGDEGYRLEVAAPEGLLGKVKVGDRVTTEVEGAPAEGRVAEITPLVDPSSRTFTVKIDLPGKRLRSGLYGKASFRVGARQGITVPVAAVIERGALTSVWVVGNDGISRLRLVRLGSAAGGRVEIISGLSAGERVVTAGADKVSDGARLQ